jgi:RNA polymerase sigma factor (sigma-70 family)
VRDPREQPPTQRTNNLAILPPAAIPCETVNAVSETLQYGGAAFVTTHWSVVLTAQGRSPAAQEALEKLCRSYWLPLYAFVRREGHPPEEAKDLTQEFFALLLERRDFDAVRREKGRLRSYLLVALKHFLANERHYESALKRGHGQQPISLDEILAHQRSELEPAETLTAEQIYERRWALTLLEQVLARLGDEFRAAARTPLFERFKESLADEPNRTSQAEIARELGMSENAVKQAFHRMRERYRQILREEIAHTVATPAEIEDELRYLITVLRT